MSCDQILHSRLKAPEKKRSSALNLCSPSAPSVYFHVTEAISRIVAMFWCARFILSIRATERLVIKRYSQRKQTIDI